MLPGYRQLSEAEIKAVSGNKEIEEGILRLLDSFAQIEAVDKRWLAIGRTYIEMGFGSVNRAITRPERLRLSTDLLVPPGAAGAD